MQRHDTATAIHDTTPDLLLDTDTASLRPRSNEKLSEDEVLSYALDAQTELAPSIISLTSHTRWGVYRTVRQGLYEDASLWPEYWSAVNSYEATKKW